MPSTKRKSTANDQHVSDDIVPFLLETQSPEDKRANDPSWKLQKWPECLSGTINTSLETEYSIQPNDEWTKMTQYKRFSIHGHNFSCGDFVRVASKKSIEEKRKRKKSAKYGVNKTYHREWVAYILEVRAKDDVNVYARVFWFYWPSELANMTIDGTKFKVDGRKPYHGLNELIASNHMDIIKAQSVSSFIEVEYWDESGFKTMKNYYWRETLNCTTKKLTSGLPLCRCKTPANPDKTLIECSNARCGQWMHQECLRHDVLLKAYIERHPYDLQADTGATWIPFLAEGISQNEPYQGSLEAELNLNITPLFWNVKYIQDEKDERKAVQCFFCKTNIE